MRYLISFSMLLACSEDSDKDTQEDSDTEQSIAEILEDRQFLLQSSTGFDPVDGTTVSLNFRDNNSFGMSAGCNSLSGTYSIENDVMSITSDGMTERGCDTALHEQDDWLFAFLVSSPAVDLNDDYLTLSNAEAELIFLDSEVATPDLDLIGPTWIVDTFINGDSMDAFNLEANPTVTFGQDGSFSAFSGCNDMGGTFSTSGSEITFANVVSTDMECFDSTIQEVEMLMFSALSDGVSSYEVNASRLTIERGDSGISALSE